VAIEVLKTPSEWCRKLKLQILDPDGWRGSSPLGPKDFEEPVSLEEFSKRMLYCTVVGASSAAYYYDD